MVTDAKKTALAHATNGKKLPKSHEVKMPKLETVSASENKRSREGQELVAQPIG